jgi:hypothetical protein
LALYAAAILFPAASAPPSAHALPARRSGSCGLDGPMAACRARIPRVQRSGFSMVVARPALSPLRSTNRKISLRTGAADGTKAAARRTRTPAATIPHGPLHDRPHGKHREAARS